MAEARKPPPPAAGGKDGKILGMPHTTGLIVLGIGAVVAGYFVISKFSSSQGKGQGQGGGQGGGGQGGYWGSGGTTVVRQWRGWQGHGHRHNPGGPRKHPDQD